MATVEIRQLGVKDARDYRAIRLAALRESPEAFGSVYEVEAAAPAERHLARLRGSVVFGAYVDGEIVGLVGLRREEGLRDQHKGFVWGFYVAPTARRQGVGRALMDAVLRAASGMVEQVVLTVVADMGAAIALYEKLGFQRYGVEPRALKIGSAYADEVLMVLFL